MPPKIIVSTGLLISIFLASACGQTAIKAEADKTSITADEIITYKVTVTSSEKNLPAPQLPDFSGFTVLSRSQSSHISLAQGQVKTVLVYAFVLSPADAGKLKIEPSSIKLKDGTYSTAAFEIEVKPGKRKPHLRKPDQRQSLPEGSHPQPQQEQEQQPRITL